MLYRDRIDGTRLIPRVNWRNTRNSNRRGQQASSAAAD
jgi:hypothetical protein